MRLHRPLKLILWLVAVLSMIETLRGAPDTARWLGRVGVQHGHVLGLAAGALVALACASLAAGPERLLAWADVLLRRRRRREIPMRVSVARGHIPDVGEALHRRRFPEMYPGDTFEGWLERQAAAGGAAAATQVRRAVPPSDLELMLRAKYASAVLSAYRDIVRLGADLEHRLVAAAQTQADAAELLGEACSWCDRCIAWANDPRLGLAADLRRTFRACPAALAVDNVTSAVSANIMALSTVRPLIEPQEQPA